MDKLSNETQVQRCLQKFSDEELARIAGFHRNHFNLVISEMHRRLKLESYKINNTAYPINNKNKEQGYALPQLQRDSVGS